MLPMEPSYELFDHTADIGFRIRAETLGELLEPAGRALYVVIGEVVPGGEPQPITIELTGSDSPMLLRDYLGELLLFFERDHRLVTSVDVTEFCDGRLHARLETNLIDRERSAYHREVKAITYHELDIVAIPGGYEATLIVDI